jgi:phosphatidylglycerophosphate synthase
VPPYAPTSRRPIAAAFRKTAAFAVRFCVKRGIHPDAISYASLFASAGAGLCLLFASRWPVLLLIAPPLMWLRLYFNMLDGMVALESGKASPRGEVVNELPDRVSDILIFAAVAHCGLANLAIAYWAALMAIMTAYVGTLSQAVTGKRRFEGVMSKQWRMVVLSAGAIVMFAMIATGRAFAPQAAGYVSGLSVLDWTNLLIVAGCLQTCYVRLRHTLCDIAASDTRPPAAHN